MEKLRAQGIDAVYIHRVDRTGYKAGALDAGLKVAKGEVLAIFDADFLPQPSFLRDIVGHFADPDVGMVQTRWGHMNRDVSLLTRVQAQMLDGHHLVENRARYGSGLLFNFSGTGGMWRRSAIEHAGGWQHDTLTEDLDLSYRAQLAGWKFIYRPSVSPSELPEDSPRCAPAYRWAKGTVQTARKLLKTLMTTAPLTTGQRIEAFFHLTPHFAYPLSPVERAAPAGAGADAGDGHADHGPGRPAAVHRHDRSLAAFYMLAESAQAGRAPAPDPAPDAHRHRHRAGPHLCKAVFEGLGNMAGEFVRTPKQGNRVGRYRARADLPILEICLALISFAAVVASVQTGHWFATPFAALFTFGYGYVAVMISLEQATRRREAMTMSLPAATASVDPVTGERPSEQPVGVQPDLAA